MAMPSASLARPAAVPLRIDSASPARQDAENLGALINLAGRQRMLSQRIVLFCVLGAQGDMNALATAQEALDLFRSSHGRLLQSRLALAGDAAAALQHAFYGLRGANLPVREFVQLAEETLNAAANALPTLKRLLPSLVARATPILEVLDALTQVYEAQSRPPAGGGQVRC